MRQKKDWGRTKRNLVSWVQPLIFGVLIGGLVGFLVNLLSSDDQLARMVGWIIIGTIGSLVLVPSLGYLGYLLYVYVRLNEVKLWPKKPRRLESQNRWLYSTSLKSLTHGSAEERLKAIFKLERIAKESSDTEQALIDEITATLCSHLRTTTRSKKYLKDYRIKPSVETAIILKVLTQGENNPFDSSEFKLNGAHLSGADISGADLSEAYLRGVDLTGADISGADLSEAYLSEANLTGADISGADLSEAYLREANLAGTDLSEVDLSGANLNKADLSGTNLNKAIRLTYNKGEWANFKECKFSYDDDKRTDLRKIYWGVFTKGLTDVIWAKNHTNTQSGQSMYISENAVTRDPTQKEKERLVGKDNVDKCVWGVIQILEERNAPENVEDLNSSTQNLNLQYSNG